MLYGIFFKGNKFGFFSAKLLKKTSVLLKNDFYKEWHVICYIDYHYHVYFCIPTTNGKYWTFSLKTKEKKNHWEKRLPFEPTVTFILVNVIVNQKRLNIEILLNLRYNWCCYSLSKECEQTKIAWKTFACKNMLEIL